MGVKLTVTEEAADLLADYPWHGNVRELKNLAEYLVYLDKRIIEAKDILPGAEMADASTRKASPRRSRLPQAEGPGKEH